jgi:hypothetical protein
MGDFLGDCGVDVMDEPLLCVGEAAQDRFVVARGDLAAAVRQVPEDVLVRAAEGMLRLSETEVQVQVHEGVVTLRGEVENRSTARIAERLAKGVDGVVTVRPMIDYTVDDTAA